MPYKREVAGATPARWIMSSYSDNDDIVFLFKTFIVILALAVLTPIAISISKSISVACEAKAKEYELRQVLAEKQLEKEKQCK